MIGGELQAEADLALHACFVVGLELGNAQTDEVIYELELAHPMTETLHFRAELFTWERNVRETW